MNKEKNELSRQKKLREEKWKENQRLRQQTGIVNNKSLKQDYDKRESEIEGLKRRIENLKLYHLKLTGYIERAQQI